MFHDEISNEYFYSTRMIRRESHFSYENYRLGKIKMDKKHRIFNKTIDEQIKFNECLKKKLEKLKKIYEESQLNQEKLDNFKKSNARVILVNI